MSFVGAGGAAHGAGVGMLGVWPRTIVQMKDGSMKCYRMRICIVTRKRVTLDYKRIKGREWWVDTSCNVAVNSSASVRRIAAATRK